MDYKVIDTIIERFHSYLPYGQNFYDAIGDLLDEKEYDLILKKLIDWKILVKYGEDDQYRLSKIGEEVKNKFNGFEMYLKNLEKIKQEENSFKNIEREKITNEAKLVKLKLRTFLIFLIISIISVIFSIFSIIERISKESKEREKHRKEVYLEQEQNKVDKSSTSQLKKDTLTKETNEK